MSGSIVVTGATGHIGGEIARNLLARGKRVRAIARDVRKLEALAAKGAEIRGGDLGDKAFLTEAFRDASGAFVLIPPPALTITDFRGYQQQVARVIAGALKAAGVLKAVALSSVGAEVPEGTGPIKGLHDFERELAEARGLDSLILRATYFMENHLNSIPLISTMGINGSAFSPDLGFPQIASKDIAGVAADALADGSFEAEVRYLLGPRDYTMPEATKILGAAIEKPDLLYQAFPYDQAKAALVQMGMSVEVAGTYVEMQKAFNEGLIKAEPRSKRNTTPTTLEDFAESQFAPAFRQLGSAA